MSISCECDTTDVEWNWWDEGDAAEEYAGKRATHCFCCRSIIRPGDLHYSFRRTRPPRSDYEERRFGDEIELAPLRLCEECGDMRENIADAGMCVTFGPGQSIKNEWLNHLKLNRS